MARLGLNSNTQAIGLRPRFLKTLQMVSKKNSCSWSLDLANLQPGDCTYGTLGHAPLGPYINGPKPQGSNMPWGERDVNNTNPYDESSIPNTGMYSSLTSEDQHNIYEIQE